MDTVPKFMSAKVLLKDLDLKLMFAEKFLMVSTALSRSANWTCSNFSPLVSSRVVRALILSTFNFGLNLGLLSSCSDPPVGGEGDCYTIEHFCSGVESIS